MKTTSDLNKKKMNKLFFLNFVTTMFLVTISYGQPNLTEKGGAEIKRPSFWAIKVPNTALSNLYKVDEGIYRCEQPDSNGFKNLEDLGVKSVLNLRNKHSDSLFLIDSQLNCFKVNMEAKDINDEDIISALKILKEAPKPIVVHCKHGADRTGVVIAMYRIIFQNWTKERAIAELKYGGFGFHEALANIPIYLQQVNIIEIRKAVIGE